MPENNNKTFAGVIAIVALITGVAAIIRPIQQQMAYVRSDLSRHEALSAHEGAATTLARALEKFVEVETQFKNLDERTMRIEAAFRREMLTLETHLTKELALSLTNLNRELLQLDAKLQVEIRHLEQELNRRRGQ